jgi:mono/diheme cytochrome c family protein
LRHIPDGQLFATITNGVRNMPSYAHSLTVKDRWAIVLYVRALQLSQVPAAAPGNTEQSQ